MTQMGDKQELSPPLGLVIFDLDGTLVDSVPDLAAAVDALLLDMRHPPAGEERVRLWVGNGAPALVRRALAYGLGSPEDKVDDAEVDIVWQNPGLLRFLHHYGVMSGERACLYPGVKAALEKLSAAGVPMAMVTNKPVQFVPHLLQQLGIESFFPTWLGGDSLPEKKPHPAPLLHLMDDFQASPEQVLMVGDSRSDIQAARAAGVACAAVSYGYNHGRPVAQEQPDWICDNLELFFGPLLES